MVVHHQRPEAAELARATAAWLVGQGHEVRIPDEDARVARIEEFAVSSAAFADGLDVVMSLGGDGTILRTVGLLLGAPVPIVGVDFGQLSYLTEVEPGELQPCLERVLRGEAEVEDRMLLDVAIHAPSGGVEPASVLALNEAVVERTFSGHTVRLDVAFDDHPFTTYEADALIVSTPTGSTAYAFSARGPIIEPSARALLLTPVSPHMLFDRSLVLDPGTPVAFRVAGHRNATLTVDGRIIGELRPGDSIRCSTSTHVARLVTLHRRHFHTILKAKFGLSDR